MYASCERRNYVPRLCPTWSNKTGFCSSSSSIFLAKQRSREAAPAAHCCRDATLCAKIRLGVETASLNCMALYHRGVNGGVSHADQDADKALFPFQGKR